MMAVPGVGRGLCQSTNAKSDSVLEKDFHNFSTLLSQLSYLSPTNKLKDEATSGAVVYLMIMKSMYGSNIVLPELINFNHNKIIFLIQY